ncbi:futalosine hydrolase [Streptomyces sp. SL13]|uniref:Futalosine hydrolase n=1 Tax=Streptantibioticus silvisoli TaxID=2705255 RepID=A0AA90K843_9ACTN|nr:futalosine hydrolase [Streptantibioticus silvisoli]MDI5965189.1 futalosine hydrolase [Streptantibioticus silvisoli]MDI5969598.1 futalosine hydrolase [Streptantibioticus silvisoli]
MAVQAGPEVLTTGAVRTARLLVVTAVTAERDAVARGLTARVADGGDANAGLQHPLPGGLTALRLPLGDGGTADLLAAGVGPAAAAAGTAVALTAAAVAGEPYRLVVSAGIGGGFAPGAPVGSLVVADAIVAADLGAQTPEGFVPVTELGFGVVRHTPPAELVAGAARLTAAATGAVLTVSTVTGTADRARELTDRHPDALVEAMEGFGVAEAAAAHGVPVLELRAVSNPVGPRDRAAWRIGEALTALSEAFRSLVPLLESS